jgi:hypothetical protein
MTTHDRVRRNTSADLNREIREDANRRVEALRDDPDRIAERLEALDAEWDIERMLGLGSSALSLAGIALGVRRSRRWLALPLAVQAFFLLHATQGWCPPLPLLRWLGFRSQQEIERERYTLRALLREHVDIGVSDRPAELPAQPAD